MRIVCWNEMDEDGNNIVIEQGEFVCIHLAQQYAAQNHRVFKSDEDALEDFMIVHWAWFKQ